MKGKYKHEMKVSNYIIIFYQSTIAWLLLQGLRIQELDKRLPSLRP